MRPLPPQVGRAPKHQSGCSRLPKVEKCAGDEEGLGYGALLVSAVTTLARSTSINMYQRVLYVAFGPAAGHRRPTWSGARNAAKVHCTLEPR